LQKVAYGVIFAVALSALAWLVLRRPVLDNRIYTIGWMLSPPFQMAGENGNPAGLSVDLVREAARRRGIRLRWVYWHDSSESALRKKVVDLWPLITISPERLKSFHISEPYLESEYCLLVRGDSPFRQVQDLATGTIGFSNPTSDSRQLHGRLPDAHPQSRPLIRSVIEDVCQQRADAAFMDSYTAISALLEPRACEDHALRWIAVPEVRARMGIGATFENRTVADALREEIGAIAAEGKLAAIIGRWGYLAGQHLDSMQTILTARRRESRLTGAVALFALLFVLACWQTVRITRERNRTKQAERFLREAEQKLRIMANNLKEMVLTYDMDRKVIFANQSVETLTGYAVAEVEKTGFTNWIHPDDRARMESYWDSLFQGGSIQDEEYRLLTKDGRVKWVEATWGPIRGEDGRQIGVQGCERDITARKLAEDALQETQSRYLQAQKLESVGRLAGGVAHDFNNLLTVINGYSKMLLAELRARDPMRDQLNEILKAGERAAGLTRQLLAFSRKQVLEPRRLDINCVVEDMRPMLERLVGEDIELRVALHAEPGTIHADPHQLEQVVMNLVVNARDAMPGVGKLLVETACVEWDDRDMRSHPEARVGRYVMLAVTDTGMGMDEETKSRIFEPFFTTKGIGKGTGLGLPMVQGIVAQSGGYLEVESEKGKGTAFKIYLPALAEGAADADIPAAAPALGGYETILVVEDQAEVRKFATLVLTEYGYRVIAAQSADEALLLCQRERIDLVLTDVVMPNLSGRDLADRIETLRPGTKVLFMSGYTGNVIEHHGVLEEGAMFIQKPFSPESLAAKVRAVLTPPDGGTTHLPVADD
jgi:PAS domain S-box-containing protein